MFTRTLLILLCFSQPILAQDYRQYHTWVNNAERCFFMEGKADSAFMYYDSAFSKFDFVFVKDCFMAAQISCYQKNDKYIAYLRKGFANGLQPWHLKLAPVFAPLMKDSIGLMRKFKDYPTLRKHYLSRIKIPVLKHVIQIATKDQTEKRYSTPEYLPFLSENIRYVDALIKTVGFPGDKIIGISQVDILKEMGYKKQDIIDYPHGMQFTDADSNLSQEYIIPILLHRKCTYVLFRGYWDKLIHTGEIHPRDVAFQHDWMLLHWMETKTQRKQTMEEFECSTEYPIYGCYRTALQINMDYNACDRHVTDSLRANLYMVPLAVDSAKMVLGKKYGFKTSFGYMWCR